jgi:L-asparaginase/Glu-tRNA(Gln) amidotransferase subunit D
MDNRASGQAFYSINTEPVASVKDGYFTQYHSVDMSRLSGYLREVDDRVLTMKLYPGIDLDWLRRVVVAKGMRGIVIELYPSGTGPNVQGKSLPEFVRCCGDHNRIVITCLTEMGAKPNSMYETSVEKSAAGALFVGMIPETALVKLMWSLAQSQSADKVKELRAQSLMGEEGHDTAR